MANYTYRGYQDEDTIYVEIKNNNEIIGIKSFVGNYPGGIEGAIKDTKFEGDNFGFYFNGISYDKQEVTPSVPTTPPTDGKSYIILNDGVLITLTQQGPKKTAVAKDTQGTVIYTGAPSFTADDKTLLEEAVLAISQNKSLSDIQTEFIQPPPVVEPNPTPQQVNDNRQQEATQRDTQQEIVSAQQTDSKSIEDNASQDVKLKGKDKFAILIAQKGEEVKKQLIPIAINLATTAGIKAVGTALEQLPDFCLPEDEVNKILDIRNQIVGKLNNISNTIDSFAKTVDNLKNIVTPLDTALTTLNTAQTVAQIAIPLIPTTTPGSPNPANAALVALGTLKNLQEKITPKIINTKSTIGAISLAVSTVKNPLLKIINILNSIDKYLKKCSKTPPQLTSLSDSLLALEQTQNQVVATPTESTYNGFILEIVEEQYSPTIKRVKAVAKNAQGIILLQTPPSFTTTPQVLIEEIKLIIDSSNLKAN